MTVNEKPLHFEILMLNELENKSHEEFQTWQNECYQTCPPIINTYITEQDI